MRTRAPSRRYDSVHQDWRAFLPESKAAVFFRHLRELENDYLMLSVSLNEVLGFHHGLDHRAGNEFEVLGGLSARLAVRLNALLHGMWQHSKHFGIVPNLAPLQVENFKTERAQRGARYSQLLNRVLLSERSQFMNKLTTLEEIVDAIVDDFILLAGRLDGCTVLQASALLQTLDSIQFDLNTCVRETDVLLKSFIIELPEDQLGNFDFTVNGLARARRPWPSAAGLLNAGRISLAAGQ